MQKFAYILKILKLPTGAPAVLVGQYSEDKIRLTTKSIVPKIKIPFLTINNARFFIEAKGEEPLEMGIEVNVKVKMG